MSSYNEGLEEISQSVTSILEQSYKNIEIIIINDNPENLTNRDYLEKISDSRVKIISNKKNLGLVNSLNRALKYVNGDYVARMDADDIALSTRIEDELKYLNYNKLDLVGTYVELIDENNNTIKQIMKLPREHNRICKFMAWGNCVCHPTWLAKKEVYSTLKGYRKVPHCEDYDFLNRAIIEGFKLGNIPKVELKYRIREVSISKSNAISQFLLRDFLSRQFKKKLVPSEEEIDTYLKSNEFNVEQEKYKSYIEKKKKLKNGKMFVKVTAILKMSIDRYFWKDVKEKVMLLVRER